MRPRYSSAPASVSLLIGLLGLAGVSGPASASKMDAFSTTVSLADELNSGQPKTDFEFVVDYEAADFMTYVGHHRLLVGSLTSSGTLGNPKFGNIYLYDTSNGRQVWAAKRPNIDKGEYTLLTTEPVVLIVGMDHESTVFQAYIPTTGKEAWSSKIPAESKILIAEDSGVLLVLSADSVTKNAPFIRAQKILNGDVLWERTLPKNLFSYDSQEFLFLDDNGLVIGGDGIARVDSVSGKIEWTKTFPDDLEGDRRFSSSSLGVLVYDSRRMSILDEISGELKWSSRSERGPLQIATALGGRVFRAAAAGGTDSGFFLESLDPATGEGVWSAREESPIASPLVLEDGLLLFTTEIEVVGRSADDGELAFRTPLPLGYAEKSPSRMHWVQQPDSLRHLSGKLYVARATAGIAAYSVAEGKELWEQSTFFPASDAYSADRLFKVLAGNLPDPDQVISSRASTGSTTSPTAPSPFMRSAQRQYQDRKQRNAAVLRKSDATMGETRLAHQSNAMSAQLMAASIQTDMAMAQMQAAGDLFNAVAGLQDAIRMAREILQIQGVISRKYIELRSYMNLGSAGFRGRFYIWPFRERGRGFTIVDLDTGGRFDFWYSPTIEPLNIFGFDMANFALTPDRNALTMIGIGLDQSKYKKQSKWGYSLPKSSVLSYDLISAKFQNESDLQISEHVTRKDREKEAEQLAELYEKMNIFTAAQLGLIEQVRAALDAGADVNAEFSNDSCGALVFAVIGGQKEMVEFLIERGADVDQKCVDGKSPLIYATEYGHEAIADILRRAGAK